MASNAERMIEAIRVIGSGTFYPLARPRKVPSAEMVTVYEMAERAEPNGLTLADYLRAGVDAAVVAEAVERQVLGVDLPDEAAR